MPVPVVTPATMRLVAWPSTLGPNAISVTLTTDRMRIRMIAGVWGRSRPRSRRVEFLKSLERSSGIPAAPQRAPMPPRASSLGRTAGASSSSSPTGRGIVSVMPPPPR